MHTSPEWPQPILLALGSPAVSGGDDAGPGLVRLLAAALRGFTGTVLTGPGSGAMSGVLAEVKGLGGFRFRLVGFSAEEAGGPMPPGFDGWFPGGMTAAWEQTRDVPSGQIRLLVAGGDGSTLRECERALAHGSERSGPGRRPALEVGVLRGSGGAADELADRRDALPPAERAAHAVLPLPPDPATLYQFIQPPATRVLPDEVIEAMAREIHASYLREQAKLGLSGRPNHEPWERLDPAYQESNRAQARGSAAGLVKLGFDIPSTPGEPAEPPVLVSEQVERLAEWEHARWNLERLREGWRAGARDKPLLQSPHLTPYDQLPDGIRDYDRNTVRLWPGLLARFGWVASPPGEDPRIPLVIALAGGPAGDADREQCVARALRWIGNRQRRFPHTPVVLLTSLASETERAVVSALAKGRPGATGAPPRVILPAPWRLGARPGWDRQYLGCDLEDWWNLALRVCPEEPFAVAVPVAADAAGKAGGAWYPSEADIDSGKIPREDLVRRAGEYIGAHAHEVLVLGRPDGTAGLHPVGQATVASARDRLPTHFGTPPSRVSLPEEMPLFYLGGAAPHPIRRAGELQEDETGWHLDEELRETPDRKGDPEVPAWVRHQEWVDRFNARLAGLDPGFAERKWREILQAMPGGDPDSARPAQNLPGATRFAHTRKEAVQEVLKGLHTRVRILFTSIFAFTCLSLVALEVCAHLEPRPWLLATYVAGTLGLIAVYRWSVRRARWFEDHLCGRALAEAMRVQAYWNCLKIRRSVSDHYLHTGRTGLECVRRAVRGWNLLSGAHRELDQERELAHSHDRARFAQETWLRRAREFFHRNAGRFERRHHFLHLSSRWLLHAALAVLAVQWLAWCHPGGACCHATKCLHAWRTGGEDPGHGGTREKDKAVHAPAKPEVSHELITICFVLLVLSGTAHAYDDRRGLRIYAQRYEWMAGIMERALLLSEASLPGLAAASPAALADHRDLLFDTGVEALQETAQWVLLHRDRPVEPGGH